jgi:UDP-N-acetylmuramyl tripeptide synthase
MGISHKTRCIAAESAGKIAKRLVRIGSGMGKSFPGYVYLKIGSRNCVADLAKKPEIGSIIITGTNGKTTTTKITSLLLEKDAIISYNYDSNTLNAIITGLLSDRVELGVFEYGIRDMKNAIPDTVCRLVDPVGVVYTNISREHSQVAGRKNPFHEYYKSKKLLCQPMTRGLIICNADDPRTALVGVEKEKEEVLRVNYYGMDYDLEDESFLLETITCPKCDNPLEYTYRYLNYRGVYKCSCGFSRPSPQVRATELILEPTRWKVRFKGRTYNYSCKKEVSIDIKVDVPAFGIHNLYNLLCAITIYLSFTPQPDNIPNTVSQVCEQLDMSILPPGRFEIFKINEKNVGIGQGDNGDALMANVNYMKSQISGDLCFIYETPDKDEEEIFEDHLNALEISEATKIHVIPGRESVDAARSYFEIIAKKYDAEFYAIPYEDIKGRINKAVELMQKSPEKNVIISGCGAEHDFWARLKSLSKSFQE